MNTYRKCCPTILAHQINFLSKDAIMEMVQLMEQAHFNMTWFQGNKFPSIFFPNDPKRVYYTQDDYIAFDNKTYNYRGCTKEEFEKEWCE